VGKAYMMLPPSEAYAGSGLGEFIADFEKQLRLEYGVPALGSLGQEQCGEGYEPFQGTCVPVLTSSTTDQPVLTSSTTSQQPSWWQGLLSQITSIVGQRIGPAPGTYQRTSSGAVTIRQPSGYTGPVQTPSEAIVRGQLAATSNTGTGLILAAVGLGVLVLLIARR
jgi:hypothetical protein